jgi:exosortase
MQMESERNLRDPIVDSPRRSFAEEFSWYWQQWPNKPLWICLFVSWLALFQFLGNSTLGYIETRSLFRWMSYCYTAQPDDQHGYLIPLAVVFLFWTKRKELLASAEDVWWPALTVVALALVLHIMAYLVQQTRISIVAFALGLYGLMGLTWGRRFMISSSFPMVLFLFAVPLATVSETITYPLRILVAKISWAVGHGLLGMPITREGSQIIGPEGAYEVAAACSGIRSLTALGAVTMIYAFLGFSSRWRRLLVLLAAFPLAVAGNVARVSTVMVMGDVFGRTIAMSLEQYLGLVTFTVAMACLLGVGYWLKEPRST